MATVSRSQESQESQERESLKIVDCGAVYRNGRHNSCFALSLMYVLLAAKCDPDAVAAAIDGVVHRMDEFFGANNPVDTDVLTPENCVRWNNLIVELLDMFQIGSCILYRDMPRRIYVSQYVSSKTQTHSGKTIEIVMSRGHFMAVV